jgi:hypothetical protein
MTSDKEFTRRLIGFVHAPKKEEEELGRIRTGDPPCQGSFCDYFVV